MGSAADCYFCGSARVALMGNGVCNSECYIGACNLDGGDCNVCGDFGCLTSQIGDGICQKECFNFGCEYDQEDCFTCIDSPDCSPRFIGDGTLVGPSFFLPSFCHCILSFQFTGLSGNCDLQCYHPGCDFDGGDCDATCSTNAFGTCKVWMTMVRWDCLSFSVSSDHSIADNRCVVTGRHLPPRMLQ